jgi:GTP-binding protein
MTDLVKLYLQAGDGGNGKVSFRREKYVAKGGPDGGYGGNGGNIILQGDKNLSTLKHLSHMDRVEAKRGQTGSKRNRHGADAPDEILKVPIGTVVWVVADNNQADYRRHSLDNVRVFRRHEAEFEKFYLSWDAGKPKVKEIDQLSHFYTPQDELADLDLKNLNLEKLDKYQFAEITEDGQQIVVCQGGFGGRGNITFKSSTNTTPREAEYGTSGERRVVFLELKLLADVGLLGFPSAGKSTLINQLTNANSKTASYHFTTLEPHLGVLKIHDKDLVIADLPGLVEGASSGKGLGYSFLRHAENTQALVYVLSLDEAVIFDDSLSAEEKVDTLFETFEKLQAEAKSYSQKLADKPYLLAVTKQDLYSDEVEKELLERLQELQKKSKQNVEFALVSGATGEGTKNLTQKIFELTQ